MTEKKLVSEINLDNSGTSIQPDHQIVDPAMYCSTLKETEKLKSKNDEQSIKRFHLLEHFADFIEPKPLAVIPSNYEKQLDKLESRFPNSKGAIDVIRRELMLCEIGNRVIKLPNLLLHGLGGSGKTAFARALADILNGIDIFVLELGIYQSESDISGLSLSFSTGKNGIISDFLRRSKYANPIIVLDEIDKVGAGISTTNSNMNSPIIPLFTLMEESTSRGFKDIALGLELDCSAINWIATANNLSNIPTPFITRMYSHKIGYPSLEQMPAIVNSIWEDMRNQESWGLNFDQTISNDIANSLYAPNRSLREIKRLLRLSFGNAAMENRYDILTDDLQTAIRLSTTKRNKRGIGFTSEL